MRLKEFLNPQFVIRRLTASDMEGVLAEAAQSASAAGVGPAAVIEEKLLERERQHPTVMGAGLAIPHATVPGLSAPSIGVALAEESIDFGGPGYEPVGAFFILLSPPGHEREHVKLLARICRLARHRGFIEELHAAADAPGVVSVIQSIDDQHV